jgi:hypothetical protein
MCEPFHSPERVLSGSGWNFARRDPPREFRDEAAANRISNDRENERWYVSVASVARGWELLHRVNTTPVEYLALGVSPGIEPSGFAVRASRDEPLRGWHFQDAGYTELKWCPGAALYSADNILN